jgi:hypothetical protein
MSGFIALYATACLNLANPGSCVTAFITDSTQNQMTMTECLGVEGLSWRSTRCTTLGSSRVGAARSVTSQPRRGGRHDV